MKNIFSRIAAWFKRVIHVPYYYVPPCPVCNSRITGRYLRVHRDTVSDWEIDESLRNGEIAKPNITGAPQNAFCLDCGYEWIADIELKFFSLARRDEEKTARHTREVYKIRSADHKEDKRNMKGPFKAYRKFMGKM
jgi:hypothetical protein